MPDCLVFMICTIFDVKWVGVVATSRNCIRGVYRAKEDACYCKSRWDTWSHGPSRAPIIIVLGFVIIGDLNIIPIVFSPMVCSELYRWQNLSRIAF
jgi:hypothetical protein